MRIFPRVCLLGMLFAGICIHAEDLTAASALDALPDGADVKSLLERLEKGSAEEQLSAVNQLGALGPYAQSAVDQLVKTMSTDDAALRYECITALGQIGPLAHEASDSLTPFLKTDSALIQSAALESLRRMGTASPAAEAQIRKLCVHTDASVATAAIRCLVMIAGETNEVVKSSIPRLVAALGDKRTDVRNEAAVTLTEIGPSVVPSVSAVLSATDHLVRLKACDILGQLGESSASAVPALLTHLDDEHELVVRAAATALGRIHGMPEQVVPALTGQIQKKSVPIRISAVRAIAEFGPSAGSSASALLSLLSDENIVLRASAADALGRIGDERVAVIEALVGALSDADGTVTVNAANALSHIGAPAVPALVQKLSDEHYRRVVVEILGEMASNAESAVPALVELLSTDDKELRREVYIALAMVGPKAAAAAPAMMKTLQDPTAGDSRAGAAYVLAHIGEKAAIPVLKEILKTTQNEHVDRAVSWSIVKLEPENPENVRFVMPHLLLATSSEIPLVRKEAISAFCTLGKAASAALPILLEHAATDSEAPVRAESLRGLAEIKAPASQALPLALASLSDPDPMVRNSARYLLGSLGEDAHSAAPMLRETLRRGDQLERILSAWALVHVERTPANIEAAIPSLLNGLQHPNPRVRAEVAMTLGTTGTKSKDVLTDLESVQNDPDPQVKVAVIKALASLKK